MKQVTGKLVYFLFPSFVLFLGMFIVAGVADDREPVRIKRVAESVNYVAYATPENLNFAGELVPVEDFEVKERFDKELLRNVYYHSATILNLKRANRWKPIILPILKQQGIPEDFFYLCIAESYLTNAISPAGAKGFWQFMPATAELYGLEVSKTIDERYDPVKATYAACRYLNDAYKKFGNWTLVAASYNMGMAGVERELEKQKVDSYYDLYLNAETSAYVFRILALKSLLSDPVRYGFRVNEAELYQPVPVRNVSVDGMIDDLVSFAKEQNTTYKMIKVMNPWLLSDKLIGSSGKKYTIQIPVTNQVPSELQVPDIVEVTNDSVSVDTVIKED